MSGQILLTVPTLTTPGPAYATQISNDLTKIATHNHDGVNNGATIDIAAQTVGNDLSLIHHNLSNVRSIEFDNEPASLTGSQDVLALYVNQGNLGFNTSDGTFVPITNGNSLAPSALSVFNNWTMRNNGVPITSNASVLFGDTYNLVALNSVGGSFTVTLPIAATITPNPKGRLYVFRDVNNACTAHPVTIQVAPASGNTFGDDGTTSFILNTNGAYVAFYTDGTSTWFVWAQNAYQGEQIGFNSSTLQVKNSSGITIDGSSNISNAGLYGQNGGIFALLGSTNEIRGGTTAIDGAAAVTWSAGATETHATGTTETFNSGSNLVVNGVEQVNGTLNLPGATNLSGNGTISGTLNSLVGTLQVPGGVLACTSSAQITLNKSCSVTNTGKSLVGGNIATVTILGSSTTYTCDSNTYLDNFIGCVIANSSVYTVNLPASPDTGRIIVVGSTNDVTGFSAFGITVNGNGHNILGLSSKPMSAPVNGSYAMTFLYTGVQWTIVGSYNTI